MTLAPAASAYSIVGKAARIRASLVTWPPLTGTLVLADQHALTLQVQILHGDKLHGLDHAPGHVDNIFRSKAKVL